MRKHLVFLVSVVFFTSGIFAASVGAAPGFADFGQHQPGETINTELYITVTGFDGILELNPAFRSGRGPSMFEPDVEQRFETSEEDISGWINQDETVPINTSTVETYGLPDGTAVNAQGVLEYSIEIPEDAEPGYHYGGFRLNAQVAQESSAGSTNWGETRPDFRFYVDGNQEPVRSIEIRDFDGSRQDGDVVDISVLLQNTGTVTTTVDEMQFEIESQKGVLRTLEVYGGKLEPGETRWVSADWVDEGGISEGTYRVEGEADYITGKSTASGSFTVPDLDVVEVSPADEEGQEGGDGEGEGDGLPVWLVLMLLAVLAVLMYYFEIDPFWILLIIGLLGLIFLIFTSGIPNWVILLLLILLAIMYYLLE